jgi:hypothetical protein
MPAPLGLLRLLYRIAEINAIGHLGWMGFDFCKRPDQWRRGKLGVPGLMRGRRSIAFGFAGETKRKAGGFGFGDCNRSGEARATQTAVAQVSRNSKN